MSAPQNRSRTGRFLPGASGNPGGRKATPGEVRELLGSVSIEAVNKLVSIMRGRDLREARLAASDLLDRSLGKPAQSVDVTARRGPDAALTAGNPDQARAKIEALIAAASQATVIETVAQSDATSDRLLSLPALGDDGGEPAQSSRPESQSHSVPPDRQETA